MSKTDSAAVPGHLGFLAFLFLIWHGALAVDYLLVRFPMGLDLPSLQPAVEGAPGWARISWALGIWLGLIAAIFAMMRDDAAVLLFFAACIGMAVAVVGAELSSPPELLFNLPRQAVYAALVLVPFFGWIYTRAMKRAAVLH